VPWAIVCKTMLDHLSQELVDLILPAAEVSSFYEVVCLLAPSTGGIVKLEGPQEVAGVLEVWSDSEYLVDEILNTDDAKLAELCLDDVVTGDRGTVALGLDKSSLVNELANTLQIGGAPCDVGFANAEHVDGGFVQLDEHSIVDLTQAEQLENLFYLGRNLVNTTDSHNEGQFWVSGNIEVSFLLGISSQPDLIPFLVLIFLGIFLGSLEYIDPLCLPRNLGLDRIFRSLRSALGLALTALQDSLWDCR